MLILILAPILARILPADVAADSVALILASILVADVGADVAANSGGDSAADSSVDSDVDSDDEAECAEIFTRSGEKLFLDQESSKVYRLDSSNEGVDIGVLHEVCESEHVACDYQHKFYAIGEEIKSGSQHLFRCAITNVVYKQQKKGWCVCGTARQDASGTWYISKMKKR